MAARIREWRTGGDTSWICGWHRACTYGSDVHLIGRRLSRPALVTWEDGRMMRSRRSVSHSGYGRRERHRAAVNCHRLATEPLSHSVSINPAPVNRSIPSPCPLSLSSPLLPLTPLILSLLADQPRTRRRTSRSPTVGLGQSAADIVQISARSG